MTSTGRRAALLLGLVASVPLAAGAAPADERIAAIERKIAEGDTYLRDYFEARKRGDAGAVEEVQASLVDARKQALTLVLAAYVDGTGRSLLLPAPPTTRPRHGESALPTFQPRYDWAAPASEEELKKQVEGHLSPTGEVLIGERAFANPAASLAAEILREGVLWRRLGERPTRLRRIAKETGYPADAAAAEESDDAEMEASQAVLTAASVIGLSTVDSLLVKLRLNHFAQSRATRKVIHGVSSGSTELEQLTEEPKIIQSVLKEVAAKERAKPETSPKERARLTEIERWARRQLGETRRPRAGARGGDAEGGEGAGDDGDDGRGGEDARRRPRRAAPRPGRFVADLRVGPAIGLNDAETQLAIGVDGAMQVPARGLERLYVRLTVEAELLGAFTFVLVGAGAEYLVPLPIAGLSLAPRVSLGYAAAVNGNGADSFFLVLPEVGLRYQLGARLHVGLDPVSLPVAFGSGKRFEVAKMKNVDSTIVPLQYRILASVGVDF